MFAHLTIPLAESLAYNILLGPLSVIVGIGFGVIWGTMAQFIPEKDDVSNEIRNDSLCRLLMLFRDSLSAQTAVRDSSSNIAAVRRRTDIRLRERRDRFRRRRASRMRHSCVRVLPLLGQAGMGRGRCKFSR